MGFVDHIFVPFVIVSCAARFSSVVARWWPTSPNSPGKHWLRVRTVSLMPPLPPPSPQYWATLERKQKWTFGVRFPSWNVASRSRQMSYELTGCIDKCLFWLRPPCICGSDLEVSHTDEEHQHTYVYSRRLTNANSALLMPVSPVRDRTPRWRREFRPIVEWWLRPWHPGPGRATKSKNHGKENNRGIR